MKPSSPFPGRLRKGVPITARGETVVVSGPVGEDFVPDRRIWKRIFGVAGMPKLTAYHHREDRHLLLVTDLRGRAFLHRRGAQLSVEPLRSLARETGITRLTRVALAPCAWRLPLLCIGTATPDERATGFRVRKIHPDTPVLILVEEIGVRIEVRVSESHRSARYPTRYWLEFFVGRPHITAVTKRARRLIFLSDVAARPRVPRGREGAVFMAAIVRAALDWFDTTPLVDVLKPAAVLQDPNAKPVAYLKVDKQEHLKMAFTSPLEGEEHVVPL